jgi:uncharacterized Zn-binding protein involved in type VI secretion
MRNVVTPAKAGTHLTVMAIGNTLRWVPAFAGMTAIFFAWASLHAAELKMDRRVCDYVKRHVPDADVAYQPGVDVDGKPVAPADLNDSPINKELEKDVFIKLSNQTAKVFGLEAAFPQIAVGNTTVPLAEGETEIGFVTLEKGKALLNGKPLTSVQEEELAVLCIEREKR